MTDARGEIENKLWELRNKTTSDFVALAIYNKQTNRIEWLYVSGNLNDRYRLMTIKPGQGLAGWVIRHGRKLVIDGNNSKQKRLESPIMLAEDLHTAILFPISYTVGRPAVLLIGDRKPKDYSLENIAQIESLVHLLILKDNNVNTV